MVTKVAIITNIPAPYRVDFFAYLQTKLNNEYDIHIIYSDYSAGNRPWTIHNEQMRQTHYLRTKTIEIKTQMDIRHIHIPLNVFGLLDRIQPEILIAWEYNPVAIMSLIWCKARGRKFIHLTDGTLYSERNINIIQRLTRKIIFRWADAYIASSSKAKEKLLAWNVPSDKVFLSLLTVNTMQYSNLDKNTVPGRLLYVGSMIKRKGLDLLINALEHVDAEYELHIVGNGCEEDIQGLSRLAKERSVKNIVFSGFKEGKELQKEYSEAQVFVLPTREDCFGLVLLEALSSGTFIVASKYADGVYDIIIDQNNGIVVDPFDSEKFALAITKALDAEYDMLISRDIVDKFSFEQVAQGYIQALQCVMKG